MSTAAYVRQRRTTAGRAGWSAGDHARLEQIGHGLGARVRQRLGKSWFRTSM